MRLGAGRNRVSAPFRACFPGVRSSFHAEPGRSHRRELPAAARVAEPVVTPWGDHNQRFRTVEGPPVDALPIPVVIARSDGREAPTLRSRATPVTAAVPTDLEQIPAQVAVAPSTTSVLGVVVEDPSAS